jgi:hypothetical protein
MTERRQSAEPLDIGFTANRNHCKINPDQASQALFEQLIRRQRRRTHMASFVLVPGAGGMAWYWHRAVRLIRAAGHEPVAADPRGDDRQAGLATYADIVTRAIAERSDVILVARSLAAFTAPLVCARAARMVVKG